MRSLTSDKEQVCKTFVDPRFEAWFKKQPPSMRTKARKIKDAVHSDAFWHKSDVFLAVEEVPETSLRILDSDTPNLKDAAFAYYRMEREFGAPLLGKLGKLESWNEIHLRLDLGTGHMGSLKSFCLANLRKRKDDFLSTPVLAAAAVNPVYSFTSDESLLWSVPGGDSAVRVAISKLYWGEDERYNDALAGWDRFSQKEGIYAMDGEHYKTLCRMAEKNDAVGFYRHVYGISRLSEDKAFAQIGLWLVTSFAVQGAAERTNKNAANIHQKNNARLNMEKATVQLEVKMHEMLKVSKVRESKAEQRSGQRSIAADLKMIYEHAAGQAMEKRRLQLRLAQMEQEEREEEEAEVEERERIVTTADAQDLLGRGEAPLIIPPNMRAVTMAPSADSLDPFHAASGDLVGTSIFLRLKDFGWCLGKLVERVPNRARKIGGVQVNFIAEFDIDEGARTDLALELHEYDTSPSAEYESWMLHEPNTTRSLVNEDVATGEWCAVAGT